MRSIGRTGIIMLLTALAISLGGAPALAHADLLNSDPKSGETLPSAPAAVTLTFSERVDTGLSVISVLDSGGATIPTRSVAVVPGQPREVSVGLPGQLPDGVYTVNWRAVSSDDGHVTAGAFAFGVGTSPGATPHSVPTPASPGPSLLGVVGKTLLYAGLAILFAVGLVGTLAFGGDIPARRVVLLVSSSAAVAGAVAMLFAERHAVGAGLGRLLRSDAGTPYLWLLGIVAATAAASTWAETSRRPWALRGVGAGAAAAMLVRAAGGHAAAATSGAWLQIGAQWLHLMAVGAWIGGLVLVGVLLKRSSEDAAATVDTVRRYSTIALWAVAVVAVTGSIRALNELGGISGVRRILQSSYGLTLAIKLAIAAVLVALGGINRFRSIPRLARDGRLLRRLIGAELVASLALFGVTATLTSLPPAGGAPSAQAQTPASISARGSDFATTTRIALEAKPGTAGPNTFTATITDYNTGAPTDASSVELRFQPKGSQLVGGSALPLRHVGGARWSASGTNLSLEGAWSVVATVVRSDGAVEIPLTLTTMTRPQQVSISHAEGQPDIYTFTLPGGVELQSYIDPGTAGPSQFHVTAFQDGAELPLDAVTLSATPAGGEVHILVSTRLSAGHFVANTRLPEGDWRFAIQATTKDGRTLTANFNRTIGAP